MSENPETPEPSEPSENVVVEPVAHKPARKFRPGRIAAVAVALVAAGAVVAGVGFTVVTVRDADRDPGRPTWKFPAAGKDDPEAKSGSGKGLSALLVPYGTDDYVPGPDVGEFGADAELSGARATALRKESYDDLPRSTRKKLDQLVEKQRIQGMAMRSYVLRPSGFDTTSITATVTLTRLDNRTAVRDMANSFNGFLAATDFFRKGPKVKGHKDVRCFLTPKGGKDDLAAAFCSAAVGDVLVSVTADGPDPLDAKLVTNFFTTQLDRIDNPGQSV
ncbi:hypothetical protein ACGFZG_33625 [Streptomyces antibioticus]|uniref:hypothetical protein n=1 Tax=Streptomyces antibioticus TaxID=1890 RepID=UPI003712805B